MKANDILYLDHASTTPCREEVWEAMRPYALYDYGNPDSLHSLGRSARRAVAEARQTIAECLNCLGTEIVFTSGGSESDNLALWGAAHANDGRGRHIITTEIEHLAVLHTCQGLTAAGFEFTYLKPDEYGRVTAEQVLSAVRPDTILVSIMHANNEVGTIQPIGEIARLLKAHCREIIFHTDAVQTVGHIPVDVEELGVDLLTFTAQKFYGPKGVGGLYVRDGVQLQPRIAGVRRERGLEYGTLSVPLIVGMAVAMRYACREMDGGHEPWARTRDRVIEGLLSIDDSRLNGHPVERLPTNVSVSFLGASGEDIVLQLDRLGICASTGSACTSGVVEPSHVLTSMGLSRRWALGALRLSFGHGSRGMDPGALVEHIRRIVTELRSTSYTSAPRGGGGPTKAIGMTA
ncbi:MAG TPA: cysteine desulfurase family protein [Pyrinomonadaceae bacterium]|nr:cysteine desulfurase family protein [Pyrinomonadaceae bacterium]